MPVISKTAWESLQQLLDQVLDLPEHEQHAFIEEACATNPGLKREIFKFLEAEKRSPSILERPASPLLRKFHEISHTTAHSDPETVALTGTIGAFQLKELLGRGGMGSVYRAERCTGEFEQIVAIKILDNHRSDQALSDRFRREQQLLASLDHPSIAKLLDGGVTERGQAYLIMEYVDGDTIDRFCSQQQLDLNQRLCLIQQVAAAVGYAHKHLIVHRDLKPSNILVKRDGSVKLLDFGIAKLLDETQELALTQPHGTPMTPQFAAPEQLLNQPIAITTDIYQLGLVSYLLCTGRAAHTKAGDSMAALAQQVCHEVPRLPSSVVANNKRLARELRGNVDAILLKMLEIEPRRRYQSMAELQQDIDACFQHKPLIARHHSWHYVAGRALRRHWKFFLTVSVFLMLLTSYVVTVSWQSQKITQAYLASQLERSKAEQISTFLINIFMAADPNVSGLNSVSAAQLLENGEQHIIAELDQLPGVRNHMLNILAQIWQRQGDYEHALSTLQKAQQSALQSDKVNTAEYAKTLSLLGLNHLFTGDNHLAKSLSQQGVVVYERLIEQGFAAEDDEYAYLLLLQAQVLNADGAYDKTRLLVERVIDLLQSSGTPNDEYLTYAYSEMAVIQHMAGDFAEARRNMAKAAELQKRVTGENHTYYTTLITNLAILYRDAEQFDKAEQLAREALRIHESIFGEDHVLSLHSKRTVAVILHRKGELRESEKMLTDIIAFEAELDDTVDYDSLPTRLRFGEVLRDLENYQQAQTQFEYLITQLQTRQKSALYGRAVTELAKTKLQAGDLQQAQALFDDAVQRLESQGIIRTVAELGKAQLLLSLENYTQATELAFSVVQQRRAVFMLDHSWVIESEMIYGLALLLSHRNDPDEAIAVLTSAIDKAASNLAFQFGDRYKLLMAATASLNQ